jgi:Ras-related protein Rab-1A
MSSSSSSLDDYDYIFKILLVGDSGAGKSCLLLRFVDDTYTEAFIATIGVDFRVRTVVLDDKVVKLQVWDTVRQPTYLVCVPRMPSYRGTHGILAVFDTTDPVSFSSVKQQWLPEIKRYASSSVNVMLVGTKLDLPSKRAVPTEEAQLFAEQMGIDYWETSSKLGVNVDAAFMDLARQIKRRMCATSEVASTPQPPTVLQRAVSLAQKALSRNDDGAVRAVRADVHPVEAARKKDLALCHAAIEGRLSDTHRLLKEDTRVGLAASVNFSRAIRLAAAHGHLAVVDRLLRDKRVDPSSGALRCAAFHGHLAVVERLMRDERVDPSADDNSAVCAAAVRGHAAVVYRLLRDERVDPSAQGDCVIRSAAQHNLVDMVARLLADKRVDPTRRHGPLSAAAGAGHVAVVERLLQDERIDPAAFQNAALLEAVVGGHAAVVKRLLEHLSVDASDRNNEAIRQAASRGHFAVVESLIRADPSTADNEALLAAVADGHAKVVALLLLLCDDRVDPSADGDRAVRIAAQRGRIDIVELLLQDGRASVATAIECFLGAHEFELIKRLECRERMTEICIALQDLSLPAWITVQIVEMACPWSTVRLGLKWNLVCAVKHFHQRRKAH